MTDKPVRVRESQRAKEHMRRLPRTDWNALQRELSMERREEEISERPLLESESRKLEVRWDAESRERVERLRDSLTEANRVDPDGAWARSYRERLAAAVRVANRRASREG